MEDNQRLQRVKNKINDKRAADGLPPIEKWQRVKAKDLASNQKRENKMTESSSSSKQSKAQRKRRDSEMIDG